MENIYPATLTKCDVLKKKTSVNNLINTSSFSATNNGEIDTANRISCNSVHKLFQNLGNISKNPPTDFRLN